MVSPRLPVNWGQTVAEDDGITGLSLNGVRKLIEDRSLPEDILDAFSLVSGAVIALAPVYLGPSGAALWPLLEPKNALIDAAKAAIAKLARPQPRDYVDQVRRFAAANTLLTYTAFFDALPMCKPDFMRALRLTENEKARIAARAAEQALGAPQLPDAWPLANIIKVRHPAAVGDLAAAEFRREVYLGMAKGIFDRIEFLAERDRIIHANPVNALAEHVAALAESIYQAEFLGIAIEYHPFSVWAMLQDRADKAALLRKLSADLRAANEDSQLRFELLGAALHNLDLGLDRLSRAIAAQPLASPDGPRYPESKAARAAEALCRRYAADVERPVIDDRYDPPTGGPRLKYPGSAAAYVPQAYRQVRYAVGETHLERDEEWTKLPAANDLGPAITRYLESPYSAESPLLILGHPGSGKSLLTRVYAARLQYPRYTVVRVELRDADPTVSIQKQVEDQIRKDTGHDVNWADLADNLPLSPPIVILDGYDELLQATGRLFTDYLDQVQRFQRDALIQNRPVRVIVTSRITLIDKAIIPPGTTVMRLEPFDEPRRTEWITHWNGYNAAYFQQSGVKPFRLPDNPKVIELAEQPLLLLMLAIFDSAGNPLSERPDLDQTLLYDELLRRFIENAATIRDLTGKPTLDHARQQHLNSLTPYWFACLLYTPLHTRPNILALLREWSLHRLPAEKPAHAALLSSLDEIVRTQLRAILVGTDPLDLAARARAITLSELTPTPPPYGTLPVLGHAAVYTLNLILLRTYLADETYTLDEPDLDAGVCPWDRLTALWRSWFTVESLAALAIQFAATRTNDQLTLAPTGSSLIVASDSPLSVAYDAAIALADTLTAESMGLHVASLMSMAEASDSFLPKLLRRFDDETRPLALITDSMQRRLHGYHPELPADVLTKLTRPVRETSELMLNFAEFTDRVVLTPRQRIEISVDPVDLTDMTMLSRYASAVITHLCAELDADWLWKLLASQDIIPNDVAYEVLPRLWRVFLWSPAAAPVLRAAVTRLSANQCARVADVIREMIPDGEITLFDVDTASALAVLAWRGSDEELCARAIDAILRGCERDAWNLLDIPLETWDGLATLFVEAGPAMASRRTNFAAVLDDHLESLLPAAGTRELDSIEKATDLFSKLTELCLHGFRIGSMIRYRDDFMWYLIRRSTDSTGPLVSRRYFLLLLRWARENDETQFAREQLLSTVGNYNAGAWWTHFGLSREAGLTAIDLDQASADLTYREAMDLRWALDLWRESGAHWPGDPTDPRG
jgi:hypothetical protein